MTEEIKEIFYKLRSDDYYEKHYQQSIYYEKDLNKLENHITNLQKENEELKIDNKRLKHNETVFKSRNEKAIEYINSKHNWYGDMEEDNEDYLFELEDFEYLLNILQGGDEE